MKGHQGPAGKNCRFAARALVYELPYSTQTSPRSESGFIVLDEYVSRPSRSQPPVAYEEIDDFYSVMSNSTAGSSPPRRSGECASNFDRDRQGGSQSLNYVGSVSEHYSSRIHLTDRDTGPHNVGNMRTNVTDTASVSFPPTFRNADQYGYNELQARPPISLVNDVPRVATHPVPSLHHDVPSLGGHTYPVNLLDLNQARPVAPTTSVYSYAPVYSIAGNHTLKKHFV